MATTNENEGGGFKLATGPSPSGVAPGTPEEKPTGTRPPFPKKEPTPPPPPPPSVKISAKDTPVAILGFSGSGKTVYLTMLYYATGVTHSFPEEWDSDYLALDPSGRTDSYLKEAYKRILGIGSDGKLVFQDPLGQRVQRNFPKGTDEQEMLQFTLTRATGVGHHNLNVKTLDVKGEALRRFAANLSVPKPDELARDPSLRIDFQRWQQMRELCEQAGAILLFFNLLNWEDYDHTADVNTLVALLLNQKRRPKAFAFVVTGIDILKDENEVEQRREKIVKEFAVAIRNLEKRKVAWQVLMISNFGRGFTRKIEVLPAGHPCSGKRAGHICNRCQELMPDVNARPGPVNLEAPWEFVYQAIRDGNRAKWIKRGLLAFGLGLLPLGLLTWNLLAGWQDNQKLDALFAGGLTSTELKAAVDLESDLSKNRVYNFFSGGSNSQREQLHRLGAAMVVFNDTKRSPAERLKAAQDVQRGLEPDFAKLVPVDDLKVGSELNSISDKNAKLEDRLKAANVALSDPERKQNPVEYLSVTRTVEGFLKELLEELQNKRTKLDNVMKQEVPALADEDAFIVTLDELQKAIEGVDIRTLKGAAEVRQELKPMLEDFTTYAEYVKVARMEDNTEEKATAKVNALQAFRRARSQHILAGAVGLLEVGVRKTARDLVANADYGALPAYDQDAIISQRNFAQFATVLRAYSSFVTKHRTGARVDEIRKRVTEMKNSATGMLTTLKESAERERSALRAQAVKRTLPQWETEVGRTENDIQAVQDLARILELNLQQVEALPLLNELLVWKNAARDVARVTASQPVGDTQIADQRRALTEIVARLKDDVPARQQALLDANYLEDKLLANELDGLSKSLDKPEAANLESPEFAIQTALEAHKRFIENADRKLPTPDRKKRFQDYLAADKRADPLKTAIENRDRFQAKLDEKRLWMRIDAGRKPATAAARQQMLTDTKAYIDRYAAGEKVAEVKQVRQELEAYKEEKMKFKIEALQLPSTGARLTVNVKPGGGGALVSKQLTLANRAITAASGSPIIEIDWNSALEVEVEFIVLSGAGQEIYRESRRIAAESAPEKFQAQMGLLFPAKAGVGVKLTYQP